MISVEDMKDCIQEWYAEICTFEQLEEIHFEIKKEIEKQFLYIADVIAKEASKYDE